MGLFDRFFKKSEPDSVSRDYQNVDPYLAQPQFYQDQDIKTFGSFALTEGTLTLLPHAPETSYAVDGQSISDYRLALISTSRDDLIGIVDFQAALLLLREMAVQTTDTHLLLPPLSLEELEHIATKATA
ncbi:hypothetical protein [Streptococcus sp. E17BB]|uniref:hypothetical protein n=1 Tax=Streptococcus sp. E17BB TaxID=3278714 RepID=UPI00359D7632